MEMHLASQGRVLCGDGAESSRIRESQAARGRSPGHTADKGETLTQEAAATPRVQTQPLRFSGKTSICATADCSLSLKAQTLQDREVWEGKRRGPVYTIDK